MPVQNDPIRETEGLGGLASKKWLKDKDVVRIYSLSRTKVYNLAKEGKIRSVSLKESGMARGTRLFCAQSIEDYIESFLPKETEVAQ